MKVAICHRKKRALWAVHTASLSSVLQCSPSLRMFEVCVQSSHPSIMPVQVSLNDFSTDSEASNHLQPLTSILLVVLVKPRGAGLKIPALRFEIRPISWQMQMKAISQPQCSRNKRESVAEHQDGTILHHNLVNSRGPSRPQHCNVRRKLLQLLLVLVSIWTAVPKDPQSL